MATETELDRIVVRLIGDGSSLLSALKIAKDATGATVLNISKSLETLGNKFQSFGASLTGLGTKLSLAITAPLTAGAALATRELIQYESALSRMQGLVGLSAGEIAGFSDEIKKLAVEVGKSPIELAQAMENITSSGVKGEAALETLTVSAKAAAGGLGETRSVTDTVTSAMNAYGVANLSATRATDVLVAAVREGKAEAESFAPVLGNVLPIAAEMQISFDEAAGSIAYLTLATGSASTAATQYQNVLAKVMGLSKDQDAGKILTQAGIDIKAFQKEVSDKGLLDALMHLKEGLALKGLGFKDVFHDVQALTGMLQLTGANAQKAKDVINNVANAAGSVDTAFNAAAGTRGFKLNQMMAQMKVILLEIGDILAEVSGQLISWADYGINLWKNLSDESKKYAVQLLSLAAAIGPVLVGVGTLVTLVGIATTQFAALIGTGAAVLGFFFSLQGAILGVGGLFIYLIESTTGLFSGFAEVLVSELSRGFQEAKAQAMSGIQGISDALATGNLKLAFDIMFVNFKLGWEKVKEYIFDIFSEIELQWKLTMTKMSLAKQNLLTGTLWGDKESQALLDQVAREHRRGRNLDKKNPNTPKNQLEAEKAKLEGQAKGGKAKKEWEDWLKAAEDAEWEAAIPITAKPDITTGLDKLLEPGDIHKNVKVHVEFKTVGAGSGEHLDAVLEFMSGKAVNTANLNLPKLPKGGKIAPTPAAELAAFNKQVEEANIGSQELWDAAHPNGGRDPLQGFSLDLMTPMQESQAAQVNNRRRDLELNSRNMSAEQIQAEEDAINQQEAKIKMEIGNRNPLQEAATVVLQQINTGIDSLVQLTKDKKDKPQEITLNPAGLGG